MSKSECQSLALLSVVAGIMRTLNKTNSFARVDIRNLIETVYSDTADIIYRWPCSGSEHKMQAWIHQKVKIEWEAFLLADKDETYGAATLIKMCQRIIADLTLRIKDAKKLNMLSKIEKPLNDLDNFNDPEGRNFPAFEKCDFLLDELYKILEWRWN